MMRLAEDSTAEKVGLFGGTFDPIHCGHLNLAVELLERSVIEEVWFCPARVSPFKLDGQAIPSRHRVEMTWLAIQNHPSFRMLLHEMEREGPSYTVDTLEYLQTIRSDRKYFVLLGADHLATFFKWHRVEDLLDLATPLVASRGPEWAGDISGPERVTEALKQGLVQTALVDVSATRLRERLAAGLFCEHLVPQKVLDYIGKNQLYCF